MKYLKLNFDTRDKIDGATVIPLELFDGLSDEEDVDNEYLYGDERLEKDIAVSFEIE